MKAVLVFATATLAFSSFAVVPAFATTGREAVNKCIDTTGCTWVVGLHGDITILTANDHVILCKNADAKCTTNLTRHPSSGVDDADETDTSHTHAKGGSGDGGGKKVDTSSFSAPRPTGMSLH